jgi:hypothetical protein
MSQKDIRMTSVMGACSEINAFFWFCVRSSFLAALSAAPANGSE